MKRFSCANCEHEVYFDSTSCVSCGNRLGFAPNHHVMLSAPTGQPFVDPNGSEHKLCGNAELVSCNWLLPAGNDDRLCTACGHNRTIPNLSDPDSVRSWSALELAKRYLFYSIIRWNLPHPRKTDENDDGLGFDFLADTVNGDGTMTSVLTGHSDGLITINLAEGDDAERERRRSQMGEPYRTLVGHMRHEVGHYYWDRLVRDGGEEFLARCREVFGDERADYMAALQQHYNSTPAPDWQDHFISTYATSHPWEDFAETFAHYLHIVDALETAGSFGLRTRGYTDRTTHAVDFDPYVRGSVDEIIEAWVPVTVALNAINRSLGQRDLYPFVLSADVSKKLDFVHDVIRAKAKEAADLESAAAAAAEAARGERWWRRSGPEQRAGRGG